MSAAAAARGWPLAGRVAAAALLLAVPESPAVSSSGRAATPVGPKAAAASVSRTRETGVRRRTGRPPQVLWVPGEVYPVTDPAARKPELRGPRASLGAAPRLVLESRPRARLQASAGGPVAGLRPIGVHRDVSADEAERVASGRLSWLPSPVGGAVASLVVTSPGAVAVRVALEFTSLPPGSEVRFVDAAGSGPVVGPLAADFLVPSAVPAVPEEGIDGGPDRMDPGEPFWSPVIDGDSAAMEIWIPDIRHSAGVQYRLVSVAHLFEPPSPPGPTTADGAPCYLHAACRERVWPLANAVAWQVFEQDGRTYGCTGQLIADTDPDTFKLYYATAAHCVSTIEGARTGTFLWFHQRKDCAGLHVTEKIWTAGGARLLATTGSPWYHRRSPDFTLLRLRQPPPAGVVLSGWTNQPSELLIGSRVDSISHPRGTTKSLAIGTVAFELQERFIEPGHLTSLFEPPYTHYATHLEAGHIDGGSSGSGLWIGRSWPQQYLIGVATSGSSSCPGPDSFLFSGAFDRAYRHVRKWLAPRKRKQPSERAARGERRGHASGDQTFQG